MKKEIIKGFKGFDKDFKCRCFQYKSGKTDSKLHFETLSLPAEERAKIRSKTFAGIAKAMAEQWSKYILEQIKE